jgi:beta-galactosidase
MPVWFGGDYNPEQWPRDVWDDDVRLMNDAHVNLATVGVFSWAKLEPREGEFDFEWLDDILGRLHAGGVRVDLATATASPPPWLTKNHPEVMPVTRDGVTLWPGSRQGYCPSSPVYRDLATRLTRAMAERYGEHPALELWHVGNEYGCHVSHCYCDVSAAAFRSWLERKYGDVEALNAAWGTAFWSQHYDSFDEVHPPRATPTFGNPTQLIDFDRFSSHELLECYRAEVRVLREVTPEVPITTNFMGFFKPADYWEWAQEVDVVSDDSYPDPADPDSPAFGAMSRDLMRSLGGGRPWILMEQAPSAVNWRRRNAAKAPGQMRAWSYQCVARGADGVLYFQWRQSVAGAEKFHSGLVPHAGTSGRRWREVTEFGAELARLDEVTGNTVPSRVAITMDWDTWWAIEQEATPARISYVHTLFAWYKSLWELGVTVDFVRPGAPLDAYTLVVAPSQLVLSEAAAASIAAFVDGGGTLLATYQTGILDENLHVSAGGYLGALAATLGVRVEEFAPLAAPDLARTGEGTVPTIAVASEEFGGFAGEEWSEYVDLAGAEAVATFAEGIVAGSPAITVNASGEGTAWYVAPMPDASGRTRLLQRVLNEAGIDPEFGTPSEGVEIVRRGDAVFAINHSATSVTVPLAGDELLSGEAVDSVVLGPQGVAIVRTA